MNTDFIKGVIVPILTPINENEFIDEAKLREQVNYVIEGGVSGILAFGSNGEFYVIEEDEMEPFMAEVESFAKGKQIGLFGSYGWGDGQWMRGWEERVAGAGAAVVGGQGVIAQETPDEDALSKCRELGRSLAGFMP